VAAPERIDVPVAGGSLAAYRLSEGPEPILAVHGITASSHAWLPVARALNGHATLLAVDLRGRGASSELPAPYGMKAYTDDMLALLDQCGIERAVLAGHSLGAYAVARFGADRPERVRSAVLVDGGLTLPIDRSAIDPQAFLNAFLGPALVRLELTFADRDAYYAWWRAHPAFAHADVAEADLRAYADHDLTGEPPALRSRVAKDCVRADAGELFHIGEPAHRLALPVEMLRAPRGLQDDPNPMIPAALAQAWADAAPGLRRVSEVPDVNHYTIVMGAAGADAVAQAILRALTSAPADPGLRSGR
jgi:pimeloyl-ACP methyl ester carboxylesterase